jgi:muconolactone D-isomerase
MRRKHVTCRAMEFLVQIEVRLPADIDGEVRAGLARAEAARGTQLADAGVIRAIWRIPGRLANCGIWSAEDATALHEALTSLPMWPYIDATVTALATHPLTATAAGLATIGGQAGR